jgi:hypothetical protein
MLKIRCYYDASICKPEKVTSQEFGQINEEIHYSFVREMPFASVLTSDDEGDYGEDAPLLTQICVYICTGDFAVKAEQQSPDTCGVPSLSVKASMAGIDATTGKLTTYYVIAEAPMPVENCAENLQHRISGFVFRGENGESRDGSDDDVHITYVESSLNDLQTLEAEEMIHSWRIGHLLCTGLW